jgi:hypothetical protein
MLLMSDQATARERQKEAPVAAAAKLTMREAILRVLGSGDPMKVPDIIKAAVPLTASRSKTPGQTVYSVLYTQLKRKGLVEQTGKGEFKLAATTNGSEPAKPKPKHRKRAAAPKAEAPEHAAEEAQA